jgi:hypothetical protein
MCPDCEHPRDEHMVEVFGCFVEVEPDVFCACTRVFIGPYEREIERAEAV